MPADIKTKNLYHTHTHKHTHTYTQRKRERARDTHAHQYDNTTQILPTLTKASAPLEGVCVMLPINSRN